MRVLLTTEGTYPFHWGGLSTWCHALMQELPDVDFSLLAVCEDPFATPRFERPENLTSFRALPLWGIRSSWEIDRRSASEIRRRRRRTTEAAVAQAFLPAYLRFVGQLLGDERDDAGFASALHEIYRFALEHDFDTAFRSETVWSAFTALVSRRFPSIARDLGYSAHVAHARRAVGRRPVDLPLALPALAADRGGRHRPRDDGRRLLDGRRRLQARARRRVPALGARHLPAGVLPRGGRLGRKPLREGAEARIRPADHRARLLAGGRDRALLRLQPPLGAADRRGSRAHPHRVLRRRRGGVPAVRAHAGRRTRRRVGGQDRPAEGRRDAAREPRRS